MKVKKIFAGLLVSAVFLTSTLAVSATTTYRDMTEIYMYSGQYYDEIYVPLSNITTKPYACTQVAASKGMTGYAKVYIKNTSGTITQKTVSTMDSGYSFDTGAVYTASNKNAASIKFSGRRTNTAGSSEIFSDSIIQIT